MKYASRFIAVLLPLLLMVTACATTGPGSGLNIVSTQEEIKLGQDLAAEIDKEQPILNNPALESYVSEIGHRIANRTERPDLPYSFKIIDNDQEINAFALPGGPVYIYTGLLKHTDNEAELASVLAHEIAHITARHATEQLTRAYGIQLVSSILLGKDPAATTAMARNIISSLSLLKFSRDDEIEADRMGVDYMFRAGYNPTAMIMFHRRLAALEKSNPNIVLNLLSTHPMSDARIDAVAREIATLPPGRPVGYYTERYEEIVGAELR